MSDTVITAGFALSRCFHAAVRAAQSAEPTEWAAREHEAMDALRAAAAFLAYHAGSPVARAITRTFTEVRETDRGDGPDRAQSVLSVLSPAPGERETVAQIQTVRLTDDLTGGKADETIPFTFDGKQLEIDLSTGNATALRKALAPFVAAARSVSPTSDSDPRTGRVARRSIDSGPSGAAARQHNQTVRAWARQNGYTVSERGRIPAEVISAYQSATDSSPPQPGAAVQFSG